MKSLTRSGYIIGNSTEVKKELTVRAQVNNELGFPPPSFKVFRQASKDHICVPRFYGLEKFGSPDIDKRPEPALLSPGVYFKGTLRDEMYQNEAFRKGVNQGFGVLSLPCGYGKTTVALAIAVKLGFRTIIIVHKEFLANQWRERIQQFCPGATIGLVQQNTLQVDADFIIVMLQSLSQKKYSFEDFEKVGTVFVDEAHHICARVFSQALFKLCPKHIYGLSATPYRKDGLTRVLHWLLGPSFFSVERENQKQIEVFTVDFTCKRFEDPPPCNRLGELSFPQMITVLVKMESRNRMLVKLVKKASKGTRQLIVLSDRRSHCEYLHSQFPQTSGLYMGGMKETQLTESSKKKIIFGTFSQAHEGLDIPTLDTIILATPKSDITQSIGRIMRETAGKKNNPHIWDVRDNWSSIMYAMYRKRKKVYITGGFKLSSDDDDEHVSTIDQYFKGKCLL